MNSKRSKIRLSLIAKIQYLCDPWVNRMRALLMEINRMKCFANIFCKVEQVKVSEIQII